MTSAPNSSNDSPNNTGPAALNRLEFKKALRASTQSGLAWSLETQHPEGYWVGRLQTNACMEAEWILALHVMDLNDHPIREGLVRGILKDQRDDGSWEIYLGAPAGDINTTVECYAALRCAGLPADAEPLERAREWILQRGGLTHIRVFTRYWLALIGEWPWEHAPNIPPEVLYFPNWFPFSIYNFASWARATLMPIAVLSARRIVKPLPPDQRLDELFPNGRACFDHALPNRFGTWSLQNFFLHADRALHRLQDWGIPPGRNAAVSRVIEWIVRHQDADGVWGGIQPPWIYSLMALHHEGYPHTHPVMAKALGALQDPRWAWEEDGAAYVQASVSPVWDTVLTMLAVQDAEVDQEPGYREAMERALEWLLRNEVRTGGDWQVRTRGIEPGGWAFEYANAAYPDNDDTAVALIVLAPFRHDPKWQARGIQQVIDRAVNWMFAMQCDNGGWAAFDRDNDKAILTKIPFCDFGEALDPPSVDVTAHVLEALAALGYSREHPAIRRAIQFLKDDQEPDGSWFGRWGVNFIYGTAAALPALKAMDEDMTQSWIIRAADWMRSRQNADGGWGESCGSYMDPTQSGQGASTASQTAWALMALIAVGRACDRDAVRAGLKFLMDRQEGGTWTAREYTGTGFPGYGVGLRIDLSRSGLQDDLQQSTELSRGFMIDYNLYRHYFPIMAMGRADRYLDLVDNEAG